MMSVLIKFISNRNIFCQWDSFIFELSTECCHSPVKAFFSKNSKRGSVSGEYLVVYAGIPIIQSSEGDVKMKRTENCRERL